MRAGTTRRQTSDQHDVPDEPERTSSAPGGSSLTIYVSRKQRQVLSSTIVDVLKAKLADPNLPPCEVQGTHNRAQCTPGSKAALKEALSQCESPEYGPPPLTMEDYVERWACLHLKAGKEVEDAIIAEAARRGLDLPMLRNLQHAGNDWMDSIEEHPGLEDVILIREMVTALAPRERRTLERIRKAVALLRTDRACDSLREFMRRTRFDYHTLMKFQDLGLIDLPWIRKSPPGSPDAYEPETATGEAQMPAG